MGVIEVMELIGEGVMYPTCVCLHIKPLKLSPEMACRPIFFHLYPLKHIQAVMERSNGPPVHITMLMYSVIGYTSPKICSIGSLEPQKSLKLSQKRLPGLCFTQLHHVRHILSVLEGQYDPQAPLPCLYSQL